MKPQFLLATSLWETFRPAGNTLVFALIAAWVIYQCIYSGVGLLGRRWQERFDAFLSAAARVLTSVAWFTLSYCGLAGLTMVVLRFTFPERRSEHALLEACLIGAALTLVIWSWKKFRELLSKGSRTAGNSIERGRHLGTREEASAVVRQQAGPEPQPVTLRERGTFSAFLDALLTRRRQR